MKKTSVKMEWDDGDDEIPEEIRRMLRELRLQIQALNAQVQRLEGMADQQTRMQDGHNNNINKKIIDINRQLSIEVSLSTSSHSILTDVFFMYLRLLWLLCQIMAALFV